MVRAAMPEAAVDHHRDLRPGEEQIGSASWEPGQRRVDEVSQAASVQVTAEVQLGRRVARALARHATGRSRIGHDFGIRGPGSGFIYHGRLVFRIVAASVQTFDSAGTPHDASSDAPSITTLDLFAGAGGLSEGLNAAPGARFEAVRAVEWEFAAAATYALNHGGRLRGDRVVGGSVYAGDIEEWLAEDDVPSVDVVIGGPPCQGFSTLNRAGTGAHRNLLWRRYAETVQKAEPRYFVLENVPALLKSDQWTTEFQKELADGTLKDYEVEFEVLNAADYGAVQARKRVIVIGHHRDLPAPGLPEKTHVGNHRRLDEVLGSVPREVDRVGIPGGTVQFEGAEIPGAFSTRELHFGRNYTQLSLDRFKAIKHNGGSRFDLPDELKAPCWRKHNRGSGDVMGRLTWEKPSVTIRTEFFKPEKGRYIHPDQDRVISHYEAALIQGFPETYRWVGTREEIARQIGNAVPIALGAAIGRLLIDAFGGSDRDAKVSAA